MPVLEAGRARFGVAADLLGQFPGNWGDAVDHEIVARGERRFRRRIGRERTKRREKQGNQQDDSVHKRGGCFHTRPSDRNKKIENSPRHALARVPRRLLPVPHISLRTSHDFLRRRNWLLAAIEREELGRSSASGRIGLRRGTWRRNLHEHKGGVSARPVQRLPLGFKKSIDDNRVSFERGPAGAPRGFAAHHRRTGIDGQQGAIGKRDFAAVRNSARIDRAMAGPQARAGCGPVLPRPAIRTAASAGPIDRDAGQDGLLADRMLARRNAWRQEQE